MATINAARIYGLKGLGAIAPGYSADAIVLDDFSKAHVLMVVKDGNILDFGKLSPGKLHNPKNSIFIPELSLESFKLPASDGYPVIVLQKGQITTKKGYVEAKEADSLISMAKLNKVAVVERHKATGRIGVGLLSGYGINGAVASTVGHDSHNLIVAGSNDQDMLVAAKEAKSIKGGFVLAKNGKVAGSVPLPYYGLMSGDDIGESLAKLIQLAHEMGVDPGIDHLITLSFLALPVLPEIRITDRGVFDVGEFRFIN
jgi:adenine deaminase